MMYELPIGVIVRLEEILSKGIEDIVGLGLENCQLSCSNPDLYTPENAQKIKSLAGGKLNIVSLWAGWPPPAVWDFVDGPATLGLVPAAYRDSRITCLKKAADFAKMLELKDIITHVGFIPENPSTTEYRETVIAVREVARHCKWQGVYLNFETGQETPTTLMRTIEDVGLENMGINLDPANLLMYGKANPVDAVDIYGDKIRSVHVKDGVYPANGKKLGQEMPVGTGLVNFPVLIPKLKKYGYKGPLIIEREISGEQQRVDILKAKELVESILQRL